MSVASEIEERRMDVANLEIGMFVCRLDRPWEETSYPLQGVELLTDDDITALRDLCEYVYIDARRQVAPDKPHALMRTNLDESRFKSAISYADKAVVEEEVPLARVAFDNATAMVDRIFEDVTSGRELSVEHVESAVRPLVASVLRNADAFFWIEGLRSHDSYSYSHAINCSALAAAFGRHMGFAEDTIISLAAGGLLMDIGKTRLPQSLLQFKGKLTPAKLKKLQSHVRHGMDIVSESGITDQDVLDIMRTHHERNDGSGYPDGLVGNVIPITGRMLGIIDTYDAMISARPYRAAISRHQALRQIYAARDTLFQTELVEQFQVCLGVYPTGSLVELSTGEVAVVMMQNQVRRLRPKVVILTDRDKQPVDDFRQLDLMTQGDALKPTKGKSIGPIARSVDILRSLASGDYGINAAELFLT
jgi:HD-GYP domain-containing protein (c-di-GMP phosphodiesterase class II)